MPKYRSEFERDFHKVHKHLAYEPFKIEYVSHHTYTPDFVGKKGRYLFELKGRFRASDEARKYLDIRKALKKPQEIIFIFYDPNARMPQAKRRKDGTYYTVSEWADKNGFKWATIKTIKKGWL